MFVLHEVIMCEMRARLAAPPGRHPRPWIEQAMRLLHSAHGDILSLAFSPDGDALAAAVADQGVFLWNLHSNGIPVHLDTTNPRTRTLFFAPDGRSVWWLGKVGLKMYDRDTRSTAEKPLGSHGWLLKFARTPDGSRMVSQHNFPELTLDGWSAGDETWTQDWSVTTRELSIRALAVDPLGERAAVICQNTGASGRWWEQHPTRIDLRSAISGGVLKHGPCPYHEIADLVFSPDGLQLVAVHHMTLIAWPVPGLGEPLLIRNDSRKHFTSACYHPSGRFLIVSSNDGSVHVFETMTWERVARYHWKLGRLRAVAVSADGQLAAAGDDTGEVVVWDLDF